MWTPWVHHVTPPIGSLVSILTEPQANNLVTGCNKEAVGLLYSIFYMSLALALALVNLDFKYTAK
jgi:hypothetical protein